MNILETLIYILCVELEEKLSLVTAEAESLAANSHTSEQKGEVTSPILSLQFS